jgi:hypothetical protein
VLPYIRRTVASNTFSFEPAVDLQIYWEKQTYNWHIRLNLHI